MDRVILTRTFIISKNSVDYPYILNIHKLLAVMLSLVLVAGLGGQAFAQNTPNAQRTLDFSSGVYSGQTNCGNCVYTEDGFSLSTPDVAGQHFDSSPSDGALDFHQGGGNSVDQIVLSQFAGQPFDLVSFDLVVGVVFCSPTLPAPALTLQSNAGDILVVPAGTVGTVQVNMLNVVDVTFNPDPNSGIDICMDNLIFDDEPIVVVGGELIPIQTSSLILAGSQTFSWMIPVVLSVLGIGLFVVSRKSE